MEKTFESLCLKGGYLILVLQSHHTAAGEFNKQCNLLPSDVSTLAHIRFSPLSHYTRKILYEMSIIFFNENLLT